jgi:hypothetical protein
MVEAGDDDGYVISFFEASSWRVSMLQFARISSSSRTVDAGAAAPGGFCLCVEMAISGTMRVAAL